MENEHILDRLDAYLDGELEPAAREGVRAHIAACAGCRAEETLRRRLADLLAAVPAPAAPSLAERVLARLEADDARPADPFRWLAPVLGLAAAAAMLVLFTPGGAQDVTAADILLSNGTEESASRWAFRSEEPDQTDLLSLVVDEEDI
jgi:anti-sigma factor RsiW